MKYIKALFILAHVFVVSCVAYKYYRKKEQTEDIIEAIMFPGDTIELVKSKYRRQYKITKNLDRLLYYLSKPRYNVDACIYLLTSMDLANALILLHYRGIQLRVIIDISSLFSPCVMLLIKKGIHVRFKKSAHLMHHKFCLVDTLCEHRPVTPYLMTGSLNWTEQALDGNEENWMATSQKRIVEVYQAEFERLWDLLKIKD